MLIICKFEELGSCSVYKRCVVPSTALRFSAISILPLKRVGFAKKPLQLGNKLPLQKRREKKVRGAHGNCIWFIELEQIKLTVFLLLRLVGGESHVNFRFRSTRVRGLNKDEENLISAQTPKEFKPGCILCSSTERIWSFLSQDQQFSGRCVVSRGSVGLL